MTAAVTVGNPLGASVLVLNRFYMAVHVINVRRAFGLLLRELAEVIHFKKGSTPITASSRGVRSAS